MWVKKKIRLIIKFVVIGILLLGLSYLFLEITGEIAFGSKSSALTALKSTKICSGDEIYNIEVLIESDQPVQGGLKDIPAVSISVALPETNYGYIPLGGTAAMIIGGRANLEFVALPYQAQMTFQKCEVYSFSAYSQGRNLYCKAWIDGSPLASCSGIVGLPILSALVNYGTLPVICITFFYIIFVPAVLLYLWYRDRNRGIDTS